MYSIKVCVSAPTEELPYQKYDQHHQLGYSVVAPEKFLHRARQNMTFEELSRMAHRLRN